MKDKLEILLGKRLAAAVNVTVQDMFEYELQHWEFLIENKKDASKIYSILQAVKELCTARNLSLLDKGAIMKSSALVFEHFQEVLRNEKREHFYSVLLDSKHRIIRKDLVSVGSLNLSIVHPREVFAPAIRESASCVLFVHNHPSGDPTPSHEDIQVTKRLIQVGELVGIKVLDHVIIGSGSYTSFVEAKLM